MSASLFGLSLRSINLMNLSTEPVQLVLSHLFITSLDVSFLFMCACAHDTVFNTYSFDSNLSTHVCLFPYATWHSSQYSLGSFWPPGFSCLDPEAWRLWILSVVYQRCAAVAWIIGRLSKALSFQAPARLSSFPFVTRERLLYCSYLYISLYSRICAYRWCNILVILRHIWW